MVRVDTDIIVFEVKSVLAEFHMLQLVLVKVRPAPQPRVDHMRKTFTTGNLQKVNMRGKRKGRVNEDYNIVQGK